MAIPKDWKLYHGVIIDEMESKEDSAEVSYDRKSLDGAFSDKDHVFRPPLESDTCQECLYYVEKEFCGDCSVMYDSWAGSQILGPEPDSFICPFKNPHLKEYARDTGMSIIGVEGHTPEFDGEYHWLFYSRDRKACLGAAEEWLGRLKTLRPELFCVLFDVVIEEYI